jgi:exodeoxyribonuclease V alpha subunit
MATLSGRIDHIAYHNASSRFTVARLVLPDSPTPVTVVGRIPALAAGDEVRLTGRWTAHPRYGQQFRVDTLEVQAPTTVEGIRSWLNSGWIKGIGPLLTERILRRFGTDTFSVIEQDPERLTEVEGMGAARARSINEQWKSMAAYRQIMSFLQENGISGVHAQKLFNTYGSEAIQVIRDSPYRLAVEVDGIGFGTADRIAQNLGVDPGDPERARACVRHMMAEAAAEGHLYLHEQDLAEQIPALFDLEEAVVSGAIESLVEEGELALEEIPAESGRRLYSRNLLDAETAIAHRLSALMAVPVEPLPAGSGHPAEVRKKLAVRLTHEQQEALEVVLGNRVAIITGGPGTGKTTLIRAMSTLFRGFGTRICLAAPTGRAARRLAEIAGTTAHTIHKLLAYNFDDHFFGRNENNPIDADLLIIDEASMVDAALMHRLLNAVSLTSRLVIVGDAFQLPPVGPGNVLSDLIESNTIPVARLTTIFRQAAESRITLNAHCVRQGEMPELTAFAEEPPADAEFFFWEESDLEAVADKICYLCAEWLPAAYGLDPFSDVQVLSPIHKGVAGTIDLNQRLQALLNPHGTVISGISQTFRPGDKVMHLKNNYRKEVYNGDIGRIHEIHPPLSGLCVDFDGRLVEYAAEELAELALGYAISVHKSQGSEYPVILCPLTTRHYVMLQRHLLYTAITRARSLVVLVGSIQALRIAVSNNRPEMRLSGLCERMQRLAAD